MRGPAIAVKKTSRRVVLALLLLVALLASELEVVAVSENEQSVVEQLAKRFRALLAQYTLGVIGYGEAASYLEALVNCTANWPGNATQRALWVASVLASNTSLDEKSLALKSLVSFLATSPPPYGCPSSLLYRVYLVASMSPTPLGLGVVDPAKSIQRLAAILLNNLRYAGASSDVRSIVFTYYPREIAKGVDAYSAIHGMALTAALSGVPDNYYWRRVLLLDEPGLELIAALANPASLSPATARRMLAIIAPSYSVSEPEQLMRLANESLAHGDYVRAAALAVLSTAAYPLRSRLLSRVVQLGAGGVTVSGVGALAPSVLGYVARHHVLPVRLLVDGKDYTVPLGLALAIPRDRLLQGPSSPLPSAEPFDELREAILGAGFNPINWSIIGGEASALTALAPSYVTSVALTVLVLDPFAPLDPWILGSSGVAMPGAEEAVSLLSEKGIGALINYATSVAHPWPAVVALAAINTYERGLLGYIEQSDAAVIARRAGIRPGSDPLRYAILSVALSQAMSAAREAGSPEDLVKWLGYYTRYASIRVMGGRLVIDYAYAMGLARLLVDNVAELRSAVEEVSEKNPVLAYWALGLVQTPYPVNTRVIVKESLGGLEEAAARLREAAGTPAYANASVQLTRAAETLEKIATGIETGNLPQSVLLAKRIREAIESGGEEAELIKKALGERGVAELLKTLEQVETLGGQEASKVAAAKQLLDELAQELRKQGENQLARELEGLANSLVEGNETAARILAKKIASTSNPPKPAKPLVERLRHLVEENPEPSILGIANAVLGQGRGTQGATGQGIDVDELIKLIREGRLGEAAKQLENMTRSNPEEAAKALQELSQSGVNVTTLLNYLNPDTLNKLIHSILHSQEPREEVLVVPREGRIETTRENASTPIKLHTPRLSVPRLGQGGVAGIAAALLGSVLVIATLLLWLSSRPERVIMLRRILEPVASRLGVSGERRARGLREQVVEEFDKLLRVAAQLYGPRKPSETHREYVARFPEPDRSTVADAALAYEEARFSSHPVTEKHLERIRNAIKRLTGGRN